MIDWMACVRQAEERDASDIHLTVGIPPVLRVGGRLERVGTVAAQPAETLAVARELMSQEQFARFEQQGELDLAVSIPGLSRYRMNAFKQRGAVALALRRVSTRIKSLQELNMPPQVAELANLSRGLVLVTGPTGSGKSTTLAALIDFINKNRSAHIITLEDPIEYLHRHDRCIVNQREIGMDSGSFASALRAALREDPDIILVGEMRDLETISIALTAAETGHLVFSTLHTVGAAKTIDRVIDVFPPAQQQQIRTQLSMTLQAVVSQQLIPTVDGRRQVAVEIMAVNDAIRNLIRENKTPQINNAIATGAAQGMIPMDRSILELYRRRMITLDDAVLYSTDAQYVRKNAL
ncbi:MAG: type IV pilus twitching motility protein PilT [Eubacteriales bacterium]|nr:type IV pilus twitching motility protein PilT [Eubacteriales bacterium]